MILNIVLPADLTVENNSTSFKDYDSQQKEQFNLQSSFLWNVSLFISQSHYHLFQVISLYFEIFPIKILLFIAYSLFLT